MAEENPNGGGEGGKPQDPEPQGEPQDPKAGEGAKPQDPGAGEGNTVNRHKYDVDIANRDKRIKELEAKLGESGSAAETFEKRLAAMEKELAESKKAASEERLNAKLTAAGCVNPKAARAVLDDYEGDVEKLREACPYLFGQKASPSGGSPAGSAPADRSAAARAAAGLPPKQ